ncbi:fungal specific transcription factor domain-containing protein 58 [Elsinoe australis]|uniref:Fungal specific transcription factor domain-containing protein 58 n=1 Tax=Elsinoe australis TaxID=40998 RepID=A0A4V6DTB9_9PEZI|nr:fungal specific transcription factor domain-containing protein 58 [Elsinoe australis]
MAELREALVKAYFNLIHPVFPVVDQSQFLDEQGELTSELPPPLLYQAVLLVGAHVCTHPLVSKDRWALKAVLFRRASMLYHLREETDRLYLTQAALLFTWHIHDGDTVAGGPWYWTGIAVRLNYGQGTHRHNSFLPTREHALHKRLWWSTFVLEVFAALELGRPCGVHWEGSDQQLLTDEDLNYGRPYSGQQACDTSICTSSNDMTVADYHAGFVRLAYIGIDIGRMGFQAGSSTLTVSSIDSRLAAWMLQTRLSSPMLDEGFLKRHLRLHYHLLVLFLHRMYVQKSDVSRSACSLASDSILHILDMLRAHDEMPRCHSTIVTVVTAVGTQVVSDLRSALAINAHLTAMALLDRLARVIQHTKSLIPLWPNAEAVYNIFESLHKDYQALVTQSHATGFSEATVAVPESLLDWPALFISHSANEDTQIHSPDLRWAELLDWTEGL